MAKSTLESLHEQSLERICLDRSLWYPKRAYGIITDRELGPIFREYSDTDGARISESVSFVCDVVRDCLSKPSAKLDATQTAYYYQTYFEPTGSDYFTGGATMSLNLSTPQTAEAVRLFAPPPATPAAGRGARPPTNTNGLAELELARKKSDFLTYIVNELCYMLDTNKCPERFREHALFKRFHEAKRTNMPRPRNNAHKVVRFGAKR